MNFNASVNIWLKKRSIDNRKAVSFQGELYIHICFVIEFVDPRESQIAVTMGHKHYDIATRAQALALVEYGVPTKLVSELTGMFIRSINRLKQTAQQRGFDSEKSGAILSDYVADAPCSGHPKKITEEKEQEVISRVRKDCYGREMSTAELGAEFRLSLISIL